MNVTSIEVVDDERIELAWSSRAQEPTIWLRIRGEIPGAAALNAVQAWQLAAHLSAWADEMERSAREHGGAYLEAPTARSET